MASQLAKRLDPRLWAIFNSPPTRYPTAEDEAPSRRETELPERSWPPHLYPIGRKHRVLVLMRSDTRPRDFAPSEVVQLLDDTFIVEGDPQQIMRLAEDPDVVYIEAPRPMGADLDTSVVATRADRLHTAPGGRLDGTGVIVGLVDQGGLDYTLDDFRDTNGNTRIAFLWDQGLSPQGNERRPVGFNDGVQYEAWDIDQALARLTQGGDPYQLVRHQALAASHATHVAGIAVGSGRSHSLTFNAGQYVGTAPGARIIYVEAKRKPGDPLTSSDRVVEAITYIFRKATELGKPCVVNVSLGHNGGSHEAESIVERTIDRLLEDPGRVLVKSAGNEADWQTHAANRIAAPGMSLTLDWIVGGGLKGPNGLDSTPNEMEVWYSSRDQFEVRLHHPNGPSTIWLAPGAELDTGLSTDEVKISSERFHPLSGGSRIFIRTDRGRGSNFLTSGTWRVELRGLEVKDGSFDAWIERDRAASNKYVDQSYFAAGYADPSKSLSPPATIRRGIAVANYDHNPPVTISASSSLGPTRDGRHKPDLVAPGTNITSTGARGNTPVSHGNAQQHPIRVADSGTSMSAPHVAGICAQLLQVDSRMTAPQLRAVLVATAKPPPGAGAAFDDAWGYGRVDAADAETLLR
jgi:subtilisin family serine protease